MERRLQPTCLQTLNCYLPPLEDVSNGLKMDDMVSDHLPSSMYVIPFGPLWESPPGSG